MRSRSKSGSAIVSTIVVVDPLRPGDELGYHPGEANLRMADVVLVNKVDSATPAALDRVLADVVAVNPDAPVLRAESPVMLDDGESLAGRAVLVVEDGPSITHGEMAFGAGTVAARQAGATPVDPRPHAVGSIRETFERFDHIGNVGETARLTTITVNNYRLVNESFLDKVGNNHAVLTGLPGTNSIKKAGNYNWKLLLFVIGKG